MFDLIEHVVHGQPDTRPVIEFVTRTGVEHRPRRQTSVTRAVSDRAVTNAHQCRRGFLVIPGQAGVDLAAPVVVGA
ncbi:hypothetical protein D3C72_1687600 [compost metagenome]